MVITVKVRHLMALKDGTILDLIIPDLAGIVGLDLGAGSGIQ